mgnify:CR=1 FL=1
MNPQVQQQIQRITIQIEARKAVLVAEMMKDFAEEVLKLTGSNVKIVYKDLPVDDPKQRQPDITKAKAILGWEPKVDRAEGLQKTYDYFKALPPSEWTKQPKEFTSK